MSFMSDIVLVRYENPRDDMEIELYSSRKFFLLESESLIKISDNYLQKIYEEAV
jgi:hypothetical protein